MLGLKPLLGNASRAVGMRGVFHLNGRRAVGHAVIASLHVATGALAGAATGYRRAALVLRPLLHLAGDRVPPSIR